MKIAKVTKVSKGVVEFEDDKGNRYRRSGGTVAWRCNNPGNLKYGEFTKSYGAVGHDSGGHSVFPTVEMGNKAQYGLVFGPNYVNRTLQKAIERYAPSSDGNDPDGYVNFLLKGATYKRNMVLRDFDEQQREYLLKRMRLMEGYKVGTETEL